MSFLNLNLFQSVTCIHTEAEVIRRRAYGFIEVQDQEFKAIHFRPYPKLISTLEARWAAEKKKRLDGGADRVLLFFNQPMLHRNFLALKYFVSDARCSLATIAVSLSVLDFVAEIKQTDAIVTEITNDRIQDRHLQHFGWESHLPNSSKRSWIKRFYGQYPETYLFLPYEIETKQTQRDLTRPPAESPAKHLQPVSPAAPICLSDTPWANTQNQNQ